MSWPRVFLKLRRALIETNWDEIMEGVKRYAKYTQEAGTEGTAFVLTPARFFEDEIYLESLSFQIPEDPKITAHKRKEAEHLGRVEREGILLGLERYPLESIAAFETRIRMSTVNAGRTQSKDNRPDSGSGKGNPELSARIASLTARMKA